MITVSPFPGPSVTLRTQSRRNQDRTQTALERLSTGKRINHAKDDPAGLIAAEQIRGELAELQGSRRAIGSRRLALAQQGSRLGAVQSGLNDLRGAVVSATGDTLGPDEKRAVQLEVDATIESLNRLAGEESPDAIRALASGAEGNLVDGDPALAAEVVDASADSTGLARAQVAADQRFLDIEEDLNRDQEVILTETLSLIEDADFAEEASNLATSQILTKAANVALVYSQQAHADTIGALLDRLDSGDQS